MSRMKIEKLLKDRRRLLNELAAAPVLFRGTWMERYMTCTRPNCKCHRGEKHGPRGYLSVVQDGKQKMHYIRQRDQNLVKRGIANNERLQKLLLEITSINLELLREGYHDESDE